MSEKNMFTSPKRNASLLGKLDTTPTSPPLRDASMYPWNWGAGAHKIDFSPASSCGSPSTADFDGLKRGRPRAESITNLMIEGTQSAECTIKCNICNRVFPREKSLQAHMRTHTGERPYICDYPGCGRAFCQSGQLKTHQRLHTGEKPFICSVEGCNSRFTHANRHCIDHPRAALKRDEQSALSLPLIPNSPHSDAVQTWLEKYLVRRQSPSPARPRNTKRSLQQDIENQHRTPVKCLATAATPHSSMVKRLLQPVDQSLADNCCGVQRLEADVEDEKEQRPVGRSTHKKDDQDRLLGALALVELATGFH